MNLQKKKKVNIKYLWINSIFITCGILLFGACKRNPQELKIKEAIRTGDHLTIAALCSAYQFPDYKIECESSLQKADEDIQEVLSQRQEFPFMKLILDPEKSLKIQGLLRANIQMGIKYRSIWNESVEIYKE